MKKWDSTSMNLQVPVDGQGRLSPLDAYLEDLANTVEYE